MVRNSMKPRPFSYLRMSSAAQLAGDSLRRQTQAAREYADKHGLELQEEDQLRDLGVSGFRGDHLAEDAGLGGFIAAVRSGRVTHGSVLLIEDLDRLSRQAILKSDRSPGRAAHRRDHDRHPVQRQDLHRRVRIGRPHPLDHLHGAGA